MYRVEPLTVNRWEDFARLCRAMGPNRSCWCMWWRNDGQPQDLKARERALRLVERSGHPVGLLAYSGEEVVGWAAVSPREEYPRLNNGRDTAPVDDQQGVWVLPCLFVAEEHRRKGVTAALVGAAVELARSMGALAIEAVPGDPATLKRTPSASYTGQVGLFGAAGFAEVARRTAKGRVVMRRDLRTE
ncbi:MAG: GNAT family N-acetyltransferase [Acidimicrobiales bacterium]